MALAMGISREGAGEQTQPRREVCPRPWPRYKSRCSEEALVRLGNGPTRLRQSEWCGRSGGGGADRAAAERGEPAIPAWGVAEAEPRRPPETLREGREVGARGFAVPQSRGGRRPAAGTGGGGRPRTCSCAPPHPCAQQRHACLINRTVLAPRLCL